MRIGAVLLLTVTKEQYREHYAKKQLLKVFAAKRDSASFIMLCTLLLHFGCNDTVQLGPLMCKRSCKTL